MTAFKTSAFSKLISIVLASLLALNTVGCTYYKAKTLPAADKPTIDNIGTLHKYFVIHHGQNVYSCSDLSVDMDNISGDIQRISPKFFHYNDDPKVHHDKYDKSILNEVHIYMKDGSVMPPMGISKIPLADIKEIRIIQTDGAATLVTFILGTAGVIAGFYLILVIVIALTKSSCPYVYSYNGENYVFEGETYGGAIASNLERDDYMPLPSIKPDNGTYRIRINNELKECQYTDVAELVTVDHTEGTKVLLDKYGNPQMISDPRPPEDAVSANGDDLLTVIKEKDHSIYFFNDENSLKNTVTMKFKIPDNVLDGKLLLKAKNSLWFDHVFGEFLSKFGSSYNRWMKTQSKTDPVSREQKIKENDFPLTAYILKNGEWQLIDFLYTVGPLASRDFVLPVDLSGAGDEVEIKIETGFMFWELDYAAMDFTVKQNLCVKKYSPFSAVDNSGLDRTDELLSSDGKYMVQDHAGLSTEVIFKAEPANEGSIRTVFLHTRGYYELIREFTGIPDIIELNKFKTPGYFSEYSRSEYFRILKKEDPIMCIKPVN